MGFNGTIDAVIMLRFGKIQLIYVHSNLIHYRNHSLQVFLLLHIFFHRRERRNDSLHDIVLRASEEGQLSIHAQDDRVMYCLEYFLSPELKYQSSKVNQAFLSNIIRVSCTNVQIRNLYIQMAEIAWSRSVTT